MDNKLSVERILLGPAAAFVDTFEPRVTLSPDPRYEFAPSYNKDSITDENVRAMGIDPRTLVSAESLTAKFAVFAELEKKPVVCTCSSHAEHRELLASARELMKVFDIQKKVRQELKQRQGEKGNNNDEVTEARKQNFHTLRGLVKKAVLRLKSLDTKDHKSVLGNQQAIQKLKQNGFTSEYKLFQGLHKAKVRNGPEACTDEIARMFKKCHL